MSSVCLAKCDGVYAVAQAARGRPVGKDVPEVGVADIAGHLDSLHPVGAIERIRYYIVEEWCGKAR